MKNRFILLSTLLISVLILSCTACGTPDPLNNTSWYLVELNGQPPVEGTFISISFYSGEISGNGGCNRYFAEYATEDPDILSFTGGGMTNEGCLEPEGVLDQEGTYLSTLRKSAFYEFSDTALRLYDRDRQKVLVFNRRQVHLMNPADLVGTDWILESMNDIPVPEGLEIGLSFTSENEASGRAGNYNYWFMDYEAKGDIIRWGIRSARDGELADDLQRFALNYLDAIGAGTHQYNQSEDTLELFTQRGDTLLYRR